MIKTPFNDNWAYKKLGDSGEWKAISVPHDAMIFEPRTESSVSGVNSGWFECSDYEYQKTFFVPDEYEDKDVFFEFEGVYHNAEVFINGKRAAFRPYGYTNFYVLANEFLYYGKENVMRVVAINADQPNSRWYSGAGIYRPVYIYVGDKKRLSINGIKVRTLSLNPAVIEVALKTECEGDATIEILKSGAICALSTVFVDKTHTIKTTFTIENAALWSPDAPELYEVRARFYGDEQTETFGIRTIAVSAQKGFTLNGERLIIRGACIHHDNGVLGARCYREAEFRKIEILKKWGYNAIRSAHNPCSKFLLEACDTLGMLVMDEYCDMWYIHKNKHDYADYTEKWYERDITDMVEKDFNHPSVVMYSLGNEVAETSQQRGIEFFKKMKAVVKKLDGERPVTAGVNIFFNLLFSMGFGYYSDEKAEKDPQRKVGSEFFNDLTGKVGAGLMKEMSKLHGCDVKTRSAFAAMDVAGYNYGIMRYEKDIKKYPDRVILGSETFCSDAYAFYEFAKTHPALIGDFVWAGMDYLGEVGIGSWEYKAYAPVFTHGVGWLTAGSGRIDIIGEPLAEAYYTKVAFELEDKPQIAVVPVPYTDEKHSPSAWKFSDAVPSWSWNGFDGKRAKVEVYSRAPVVELYINGEKVGRKKFKKNCRFDFSVTYRGGEITAVALDENGKELSRNTLYTAGDKTQLSVLPEKTCVKSGEVCFVKLFYTDEKGIVKPLERGVVGVEVEGGELLAVGCACPYNKLGFTSGRTDTYYGKAIAVVKAGESGRLVITATDGRYSGKGSIIVRSEE